jgi:uncharacterized protein YjbI with pentapeptide repeats
VEPWRAATVVAAIALASIGIVGLWLIIALAPQRLVEATQQRSISANISLTDRLKAENDIRTTLIQALGGFFLLVGAVSTLRQLRLSREQLRVTRDQQEISAELSRAGLESATRAQNSEAMTRAVDQIGSASLATRLGGIASLERLTLSDLEVRSLVMEILSAMVRDSAPRSRSQRQEVDGKLASDWGWWGKPSKRPSNDVQLAITVLGRLRYSQPDLDSLLEMTDHGFIDFESTDLRGARLALGHFEGAMFRRADVRQANLSGGFFDSAVFFQANCVAANLAGSFPGVSFDQADMRLCDFHGADLSWSTFDGANLAGASLVRADLRHADLSGAILDSVTRIDESIIDGDTKFPADFDISARNLHATEEGESASSNAETE